MRGRVEGEGVRKWEGKGWEERGREKEEKGGDGHKNEKEPEGENTC